MDSAIERLAKELVDAVDFDVNGRLIGGKWMGGHGGLTSNETIAKADEVRRELARLERERQKG